MNDNGPAVVVIAIDGPSASGKGTVARRLATRYGLAHLDTGLLYRAVGMMRLDEGGDLDDPAAAEAAALRLQPADLERPELRNAGAATAASHVAAIAGVRSALLMFQRQFAAQPPGGAIGAVLDGRDIGTVIRPDADVKLYVTAAAMERARRRCDELGRRGEPADYGKILAAIEERDRRDAERAEAPLRKAEDAHLLDTTSFDIDEAVAKAVEIVERVAPQLKVRTEAR